MAKTSVLSRRLTDPPVPQSICGCVSFIYIDLKARLAGEVDAKILSQSTEQGQVEELRKVQGKVQVGMGERQGIGDRA